MVLCLQFGCIGLVYLLFISLICTVKMTEVKYTRKQVIEFFNFVQNYLCLLEVFSGSGVFFYLCRNDKDSDYTKLLQNPKEAGLPTTLEQMKKDKKGYVKLKTINRSLINV